jgi:uncharacterized membrane protein YfcA
MVALAFWAWVLPPESAGPLVVACSLLGQVLNGRTTLAGLRMPAAWPFIAGGALGVPVGAWLLPHIDAPMFRLGLGLFLVVWCPVMLAVPRLPRVTAGGRAADALAGWLGGVLGGIGGLSGPVPTLWVTLRRWDKAAQRALFQAFNTFMHALALTAFAVRGLVGAEELRLFAFAAPAMLLPLWAGTRAYARLGDHDYRRIVILLLLAAGSMMIVNGISKPG